MPEVQQTFRGGRLRKPRTRRFQGRVGTLAADDSITMDVRSAKLFTIIAAAGATVVVSRVDSLDARIHGINARLYSAPPPNALTTYTVDWPFIRVTTTGAGCVVRAEGIGERERDAWIPEDLGSSLINWQGPEALETLPLGAASSWPGQGGKPAFTAVTAGSIIDDGGRKTLSTVGASSHHYTFPDSASYVSQQLSFGMAVNLRTGGTLGARLTQGLFNTDVSWILQFATHATSPAFRTLSFLPSSSATDVLSKSNGVHTVLPDTWASVIAVFDGTQSVPKNRLRYWVNGAELPKNEFNDPPTTTRDVARLGFMGRWDGFAAGGFDTAYWRAIIIDKAAWTAQQIADVNRYLRQSFGQL